MTAWVFVMILCCPASAEHTITWSSPTMNACWTMQRVIAREIRGFGIKARISDCSEEPIAQQQPGGGHDEAPAPAKP